MVGASRLAAVSALLSPSWQLGFCLALSPINAPKGRHSGGGGGGGVGQGLHIIDEEENADFGEDTELGHEKGKLNSSMSRGRRDEELSLGNSGEVIHFTEDGAEDATHGKLAVGGRRRGPRPGPTTTAPPAGKPALPTRRGPQSDRSEYCEDLPDWTQPGDSYWKNSAFAGSTCDDLKELEMEGICDWLSQGVFSGPSASQACCFCGGGSAGDFELHCSNMEWNSLANQMVSCEKLDALPNDKIKKKWCDKYGNESFTQDGLTLKEACCFCGGGDLGSLATARRLRTQRKPRTRSGVADLDDAGNVVFGNDDGDAPGISNLEYLGLGYDLLRGNPRGSGSSELDPGFRYRVLRLRQSQANQTIDGQFQVPLGTAVKYTSSCKYDDSSLEVSSESDLRNSMSREAAMFKSKSSSSRAGMNLLIYDFKTSVSERKSFSQSEKFQAQSEENRLRSSVSFEARAICSEFEASFIPGYDHELSAEFKKARDGLPVPYNKNNRRHRNAWDVFFTTFGTHYVRYLVLGGKRIHSTSMSQQDYTSLVSQSVNVASTISFEMGSALGASSQVKAGLVKAAANLATKFGGPKGAAIGSIVNVGLEGVDDAQVLFGANVNEKSDYSLGQFASSQEQAESAFKISQKKLVNQEYTIGGLPNDDWRAWAETVKEKPMPVRYELDFILDFMSFEQIDSFIAAFEDIYGVKVSVKPELPFLNGTVHHGVYTGTGDPLSLHTLNPNDDSRVLMQNDIDGVGASADPYIDTIFFDGECLDSLEKIYSYVLARDVEDREACFRYCTKLDNIEYQVGATIVYTPRTKRPTKEPTSQPTPQPSRQTQSPNGKPTPQPTRYPTQEPTPEPTPDIVETCRCNYDAGKLPPNKYTGYFEGSGPVSSGNAVKNLKCYPNENYQRQTIFLYSGAWKGKLFKPSALFATPIHGKISPDEDEEFLFPFNEKDAGMNDDLYPWDDELYFTLTGNINSHGVLAVTNFGGLKNQIVSNSKLPLYSFVTIDTLRRYGNDFRSGVVAHTGLMLNEEGKDEFSVRTGSLSFRVNFKSMSSYDEAPTVLAFPNWFSINGEFQPRDTADLNYAVTKISKEGFVISHGKASADSYLGFNFIVIGAGMHQATKNIKYGIINECTPSWQEKGAGYPKYGISISSFQSVTGCQNKTDGMDGWVQEIQPDKMMQLSQHAVVIKFDDPPFTDIPSVIATPFKDDMTPFDETVSSLEVTRCVVEHITKVDASAKCSAIRKQGTSYEYSPIPFAFLAVGNVENTDDSDV